LIYLLQPQCFLLTPMAPKMLWMEWPTKAR